MSLTDDDLARLKDRFINDPRSHRAKTMVIGLKDIEALLARLEAAEKCGLWNPSENRRPHRQNEASEMTPSRELAEKIHSIFFGDSAHVNEPCDDVKLVESLLSEAMEEAVLRQYEGDKSPVAVLEQHAYAKGRQEAFEEAAKICDRPIDEPLVARRPGFFLAEQIRLLAGKGEA